MGDQTRARIVTAAGGLLGFWMALGGDALADCTPDPAFEGATVTCTGVDTDGFIPTVEIDGLIHLDEISLTINVEAGATVLERFLDQLITPTNSHSESAFSIYVGGDSHVVNLGSVFAEGDDTRYRTIAIAADANSTVENHGTIMVSGNSGQIAGIAARGIGGHVLNTGTVEAHGDYVVGISVGDGLVTNDGTVIVSGDDATGISHGGRFVEIVNNGTILATAVGNGSLAKGIGRSAFDTVIRNNGEITVDATATGASGFGILSWYDSTVENNGTITVVASNQAWGISTNARNTVVNNGTISVTSDDPDFSGFTAGISAGSGSTITNNGDITVNGLGRARGITTSTFSTVINTGTIDVSGIGEVIGISVGGFNSSGRVENTGTITAETAIWVSQGSQRIINSGTLNGNVLLGPDNEFATNTSTGIINGTVNMGAGGNSLVNEEGGLISSGGVAVTGGGKFFITNEGTIVGDIVLGNANDTLRNFGTTTGDVDLGGGDDILAWRFGDTHGIDGALSGGPGEDIAAVHFGEDVTFSPASVGDFERLGVVLETDGISVTLSGSDSAFTHSLIIEGRGTVINDAGFATSSGAVVTLGPVGRNEPVDPVFVSHATTLFNNAVLTGGVGAPDSPGISAMGNDHHIINNGSVITAGTGSSEAISVFGLDNVIDNYGIVQSDSTASGIKAWGRGHAIINRDGAVIRTTGSDAFGALLGLSSRITNKAGGLVETSGSGAHGIALFQNGVVVNAGTIMTHGTEARGISDYERGGHNVLNTGLITTEGENADGILFRAGFNQVLSTGSIVVTGPGSIGVNFTAGAGGSVDNGGTISAPEIAIKAANAVGVANSGEITGDIILSDQADSFTNWKLVTGDVDGGLGTDIFVGKDGGVVDGDVLNFEIFEVGNFTFGGNVTFGGDIALAGNTVVVEGIATVASGAALSGSGTIVGIVTNNGTVSPGNSIGTLAIDGDYRQGADGILSVEIGAGGSDLLSVGGTAGLNGTIETSFVLDGLAALDETSVAVLTAGTIEGGFDNEGTTRQGFWDVTVTTGPSDVQVSISNIDIPLGATSPSVGALGGALASILGASSPASAQITELSSSSVQSQQITGQASANLATATIGNAANFNSAILGRLEDARFAEAASSDTASFTDARSGAPAWVGWVGYSFVSHFDREALERGARDNVIKFSGGADIALSPRARVGYAIGLYSSDLDASRFAGDNQVEGIQASAYGAYRRGKAFVNTVLGVANNRFELERKIDFGFVKERLSSETDGTDVNALVEAGYDLSYRGVRVIPFASLQGVSSHREAYREDGGVFALNVAADTAYSLQSALGVKLGGNWTTAGGLKMSSRLKLAWAHEYLDHRRDVRVAFARLPEREFFLIGRGINRDALEIETEMGLRLTGQLNAVFKYRGLIGSRDTAHGITLGFNVAL